ncbi:hypothetical protein QVD17_05518 [Tagetes erecta]|uniref:Uncharacterized protein n=1 Tax=Tagetes erecta TaxID=13708 RepID=A0AAD8PAL8_TARER|nr:hypothetical protein QVD17_05518 [Tagetes erecta]
MNLVWLQFPYFKSGFVRDVAVGITSGAFYPINILDLHYLMNMGLKPLLLALLSRGCDGAIRKHLAEYMDLETMWSRANDVINTVYMPSLILMTISSSVLL